MITHHLKHGFENENVFYFYCIPMMYSFLFCVYFLVLEYRYYGNIKVDWKILLSIFGPVINIGLDRLVALQTND